MKIVNYSQEYEAQVVDLWNRELIADTITVSKFRRQALFDENFDESLCYVALEENIVIGFLLAIKRKFPYLERGLEPNRGWVSVMFVKREYQHQGVGSELLVKAEHDLKKLGVSEITIAAYSPNYFFAGVDIEQYQPARVFFKKHGYLESEESYSMAKDLHLYEMDDKAIKKKESAEAEGFQFLNFDYKYALDLLEFAKQEFGGGWKRNLLLSMQDGTAEDRVLVVVDKNDEIVGFCMRMIDGNPMRFGPIGVKASARNYGIGGILLDLMQEEMKKRGIYHMFFLSTDEPGRRFYERHDLSLIRTYVGFKKEL